MTGRRHDSGLTLAETLVALFVTALVATAAAGALGLTAQNRQAVEAASERVRALETAHALIRDDIAQASWRGVAADGRSVSVAFEGGASPLLRIVRGGWTNPGGAEKRGGVQHVVYELKDGGLVRRAYLRPDPVARTPQAEQVLLGELDQVSVAFFAAGRWAPAWRAGSGGRLPEAVRLRFAFDDGRAVEWVFLSREARQNV